MHLALPWNHSVNVNEGFMHATNFCTKELGLFSARPNLLAIFTDHVLNANSKRWVNKQEFLGAADLRPFFNQWAGSRSFNVLSSQSTESSGAEDSQAKNRSFHSRNKNSYKPYSNNNTNSTKAGGDKSKDPGVRSYNAGTCPNSDRDCTMGQNGAGENLLHLCSYEDSRSCSCCRKHAEQIAGSRQGSPPAANYAGCEARRRTCNERETRTEELCEVKLDYHIVSMTV
jgi:hypothetical protein